MQLINTQTMRLCDFGGAQIPEYAILSHRWQDGEITYHDMISGNATRLPGYTKIWQCCKLARSRGFEYVWIDTCCIDKSSSAELTETINSMFQWYANAGECYVYLADVGCSDLQSRSTREEFSSSVWFSRGWTLQELLAPSSVFFYNRQWQRLGHKRQLQQLICAVTHIEPDVLIGNKLLDQCTTAEKMSWAASRTTTRPEDRAYSLLGIFSVHMPLLYGEGERAFQRLQEEIIRHSDDQTIFAWCSPARTKSPLAPSPSNFRGLGNLVRMYPANDTSQGFTMVNTRLSIELDLIPWTMNVYLAPLRCGYVTVRNSGSRSIRQYQRACIFLQRTDHDSQFIRVAVNGKDMVILSGDEIAQKRNAFGIPNCHVLIRHLGSNLDAVYNQPSHYGFTFDFTHNTMFSTGSVPQSNDVLCFHRWKPNEPVFQIDDGNQHAAGLFRLSGISTGYYMYLGFDREFAPVCLVTTRSPRSTKFNFLPADLRSINTADALSLLDMDWICKEVDQSPNQSDTLVAVKGDRRRRTTIHCKQLALSITIEWLNSKLVERPAWHVTFRQMQRGSSVYNNPSKALSEISSRSGTRSSMKMADPVERQTHVLQSMRHQTILYTDIVSSQRRPHTRLAAR